MKFKLLHTPHTGPYFELPPFEVEVVSPEEGWRICDILTDYDEFKITCLMMPNFNRFTDLLYWNEDKQKWVRWYDENGKDFYEHFIDLEEDEED